MTCHLHPAAEAEYLESVAYYEANRPGLGASYIDEFESAMRRVSDNPRQYPIKRKPDLRGVQLNRFPFSVFYRERKGAIQVLAVAHQRRRPDYWLDRI